MVDTHFSVEMNTYVQQFTVDSVDTNQVSSTLECELLLRNEAVPSFTVYHQNIRSLTKHFSELELMIQTLSKRIDCIVVTETWKLCSLDLLKLPGYDVFYNEGNVNKSDGAVVYIKSHLNYQNQIVNIGRIRAIETYITQEDKKIRTIALY